MRDGNRNIRVACVFQKCLHIGAQISIRSAFRRKAAPVVEPCLCIGKALLILRGKRDDGNDELLCCAFARKTDCCGQGNIGGSLKRKRDRAVCGDDPLVAAFPTDRAIKALRAHGKVEHACFGNSRRRNGQRVLYRRDGSRRLRIDNMFAALPSKDGIAAVRIQMISSVAKEQDKFARLHFRCFLCGSRDRHAIPNVTNGGLSAARKIVAVFYRTEQITRDRSHMGRVGACCDRADGVAVLDARRIAHRMARGNAGNIVRAADRAEIIAVFNAGVAVVRIA